MIDKTYLTGKYSDTDKEGHYAEFYQGGQLKHLGYYKHGSCADAWALNLEEGIEQGKVIRENGYQGSAEWESYRDGASDQFDAWSDNTKPTPMPFEVWVKHWIEKIFEYHA